MYWCSKARDLPLEGRMGQGIHFAMDYLTEQMQVLNGELKKLQLRLKDKNMYCYRSRGYWGDCVSDCFTRNCKSIVQFNKYTKAPEEITFESNTSWPLALPVFKMDYAHKEYEARFGRASCIWRSNYAI